MQRLWPGEKATYAREKRPASRPEPNGWSGVVKEPHFQAAIRSRLVILDIVAKEDAHGYDHAYHHCPSHSVAERRLVRPRTLVLNEDDVRLLPRPGTTRVMALLRLIRQQGFALTQDVGRALRDITRDRVRRIFERPDSEERSCAAGAIKNDSYFTRLMERLSQSSFGGVSRFLIVGQRPRLVAARLEKRSRIAPCLCSEPSGPSPRSAGCVALTAPTIPASRSARLRRGFPASPT